MHYYIYQTLHTFEQITLKRSKNMARIQISFKNNDTENKLYQEVIKAYDKSAFIKDCIRFYLDNKDIKLQTKEDGRSETNEIDNIDWEF